MHHDWIVAGSVLQADSGDISRMRLHQRQEGPAQVPGARLRAAQAQQPKPAHPAGGSRRQSTIPGVQRLPPPVDAVERHVLPPLQSLHQFQCQV